MKGVTLLCDNATTIHVKDAADKTLVWSIHNATPRQTELGYESHSAGGWYIKVSNDEDTVTVGSDTEKPVCVGLAYLKRVKTVNMEQAATWCRRHWYISELHYYSAMITALVIAWYVNTYVFNLMDWLTGDSP